MGIRAAIICLVATTSLTSSTWAQEAEGEENVKQLFADGVEAARKGNPARAEELFEQALSAKEHPRILANLARAETAQGKHAEAATHLRQAVALAEEGPEREDLSARLAQARSKVGELLVVVQPGDATVRVDDEAIDVAKSIFVMPGMHTVLATLGGASESLKVELVAGDTKTVNLEVEQVMKPAPIPLPSARVAPPEEAASSVGWWPAATLGGLALVAAGVGAGLWTTGAGAGEEFESLREQGEALAGPGYCRGELSPSLVTICREALDQAERHDDFKNTAVGVWIAGGALLAGAGALLTTHLVLDDHDDGDTTAALSPTIGGVSVLLRRRW